RGKSGNVPCGPPRFDISLASKGLKKRHQKEVPPRRRLALILKGGDTKGGVMIGRGLNVVLLATAMMLVAPSAFALKLKPGLWQDTETGTTNGQPKPPEVSTDCLSPEEAADPVKAALANMKDVPTS